MAVSVLGGASIGAFANFIEVKTIFAKNAWRSGLNVVMFIIPAIVEFYLTRGKVDYKKFFTIKNYAYVLVTIIFWQTWTLGLFYATHHTI